ncbi:unnamed protein product [Ceratitis capitata]|uniref:(Mediterranean fruit fly) hypothetical protein n=1 Tax=Ceratitis capitata TaxID=7213 RepID=A0A811V352_CERCA|nr:unnamed protein product [Ceratitis capitata]
MYIHMYIHSSLLAKQIVISHNNVCHKQINDNDARQSVAAATKTKTATTLSVVCPPSGANRIHLNSSLGIKYENDNEKYARTRTRHSTAMAEELSRAMKLTCVCVIIAKFVNT